MRIALVHDYLNQYGGAERVLQVLCSMFPLAPIYTTLYDKAATGGVFDDRYIRTSFLQNIPFSRRYHHAFSFLMPLAVENMDLSQFDIVLSVASSFSKGIIVGPHAEHMCYCLTPPRFLWDDSQKFVGRFGYPWFIRKLSPLALSYLRLWDRQASERVDKFISISEFVGRRIAKYYGRQSDVVYPPVNLSKFKTGTGKGGYFIVTGRFVTYKRFDLVIEAFNKLGIPLKVVGSGMDEKRLRSMAGPNIEFCGQVSDDALSRLYMDAAALIFPQEEDFGIVPLEAMASGRPVIAFGSGGALETVVAGKTGIFFPEQTADSLIEAIRGFNENDFRPEDCRKRAEDFSIDKFIRDMDRVMGIENKI